ncbi:transcriptional regulator, LysR family [Kribbella flavida DSM 17836]|uniref:Transcriptional regulator, LysR family n=1 Tax=Kribbella flavida (strain DSM 17836 / JCM 10339 / NBRC 14399) TaxID=479435 RepID=D2PKF7_KRIFD|nr:LysR family transcriptional regulator [Kribbella flavida]ADB30469.1 transcriptional regulator, LysR family [Kribbella flavida DSM 17836]
MRYDLDDLRLFVHVVTEGSITAGARRMHLSLPSASARVRALEAQAGLPLLIRERRGIRPTPAGSTLARHAESVLAETTRLDSAVASYTAAPRRPVVLVAGASGMHRLVPRALTTFLRAYPEYDVSVSERPTPDSLRLLADGEADLGIVLHDEAGDTDLRIEQLSEDHLVVIGQAGGVLTGRTGMTYREAAEHPMVGLSQESSLRQWIDRHLPANAPVARYRTQVPDLHSLITLATAGAGLAIAPRPAVTPRPDLDICPLQDSWSLRRHLLAHGTRRSASRRATNALADHIRAAASS